MKALKYILITIIAAMAFASCTDDDKTIFDPNNAKPGELLSVKSYYKLLAHKSTSVIETFQWGKMDFGYAAAITYSLEVDLEGKNFENPQVVFAANDYARAATVAELNAAMMDLQAIYGFGDYQVQNVEFRIRGSISDDADFIYSNVIKSSILPYPSEPTYPMVTVLGTYNGWSHVDGLRLFSFNKDDNYEGWIYFDDKGSEGFKISGSAPEKWGQEGEWDNNAGNWGLTDGQQVSKEASSITLWSDGGSKDIKEVYYKKYYKFSFNKATAELTVLKSMDTPLSIKGTATKGSPIELSFDAKQQAFVGNVSLVDGEFTINGEGINLGMGAQAGTLVDNGTGIKVTAGNYALSIIINNSNDMKYRMKTPEPLDPSIVTPHQLDPIENAVLSKTDNNQISWTEFDFGYQDLADIAYIVQIDLAGANFSNPQTIATVNSQGKKDDNAKPQTISISGSTYFQALQKLGKGVNEDVNVEVRVIAKPSNYDKEYISNTQSFKLNIKQVEYYENVYMIGEVFGNWVWTSTDVVHMVPVNGKPGNFWTIQYLEAGKQFKWSEERDWSGKDFNGLDFNEGFKLDGGNATVVASGLYMIFINQDQGKILVEPAQIFGMGDAFGGWDMGAFPMTVTGKTATIKTSATIGETADLRLYANSSISPIGGDWWRMEFIILDGKVVYRGNGNDQDRVKVTAGQTVSLDFSTPNATGSIE